MNIRNIIQTAATFILFGSLIPAILLKQFTVINPEYLDMGIFFGMIIALLLIIISFLFPKK